jgi:hypothetical protein
LAFWVINPNLYYLSSHTTMLRNHLTIGFRTLRRDVLFTLINVVGLGLGIVCSLLILLWVQDELRFDAFHARGSRFSG